jgi:hypothetical protein
MNHLCKLICVAAPAGVWLLSAALGYVVNRDDLHQRLYRPYGRTRTPKPGPGWQRPDLPTIPEPGLRPG